VSDTAADHGRVVKLEQVSDTLRVTVRRRPAAGCLTPRRTRAASRSSNCCQTPCASRRGGGLQSGVWHRGEPEPCREARTGVRHVARHAPAAACSRCLTPPRTTAASRSWNRCQTPCASRPGGGPAAGIW